VPPGELDGGTSVDRMLYGLFLAIHYARISNTSATAIQYLETAVRLIVAPGIESQIFDASGNLRRSFVRRILHEKLD